MARSDEDPTAGLEPRPGPTLSLRVIGEGLNSAHRLPPTGTVVIGRSQRCDVRIDHPSISRRHAVIYVGVAIEVEDLGSAHGTRVGARTLAVGERTRVQANEVIDLGSVMLVVQRGFAAQPTVEPAPRKPAGEARGAPGSIVMIDPAMVQLYKLLDRVASSNVSVLLLGETGVGKEVLAEAVHARSPRASRPLVRLNCGAISETLLESELFGHEKGAFTGATTDRPGLLETAHGGSVFLDEVGEMPQPLQVKLLRVLEDRQVLRVGARKPRPIDVRFIAATNRDLEAEVEAGRFRADLFYRLNGIALTVPPLRERVSEIEPLARAFVEHAARQSNRTPPRLDGAALARLKSDRWSGNIRELRNVIERAVVICPGDVITVEHLPPPRRSPAEAARLAEPAAARAVEEPAPADTPEERERRTILEALERCAGNQTHAARMLGISRTTLVARLEAYGVPRPRKTNRDR
jgi:DNA-binding NtrC family response regulator